MSSFQLLINSDTWLKQSTGQASRLSSQFKFLAKRGTAIALRAFEAIDDPSASGDADNHVKVHLAAPVQGITTWFLYQRDGYINDSQGRLVYPCPEEDNDTKDRALSVDNVYRGRKLVLPNGIEVFTDQAIIQGGSFTWGEATHGGSRLPLGDNVVERMLRLARELQVARSKVGKPFRVTSWYRPDPWNARVGGARRSQHLSGGAVDIVVKGLSGRKLGAIIQPDWKGGMGIYPGNRQHILHLDVGVKRSWGF